MRALSEALIAEITKRLQEAYNPQALYLFGSFAWGTPHEQSDVDVCVVVDTMEEKPSYAVRKGYVALRGLGIAKDIIVVNHDDFTQKASHPSTLLYKIAHEGKKLYERRS